MGDASENERESTSEVDKTLNNFLGAIRDPPFLEECIVKGEADGIYHLSGLCVIIREENAEMGSAGGAYVQIARSFDLACKWMGKIKNDLDAPVFLL